MNLETNRLLLTELTWKDLPLIHEMHLHPEVAFYNTIGIPTSLGETKKVIRSSIEDLQAETRKHYGWLIRSKDSHDFIGEAGMNLSNDRFRMGEIHYSLLPIHWGNGYATEVVRSLIAFGFDTLNLHRIQAGVATENIASIRVLEKVGMTREGRKRKILPIRGEWKDNFQYAIIEDDERG